MRLAAILCVVVLVGCAAPRKEVKAAVVFPRACLESVALKDDTECQGPDEKHIRCSHLTMVVKSGCGVLEVKK